MNDIQAQEQMPTSSIFDKILVAVDGSEHADRALQKAIELIQALSNKPSLTAVHVNPVMMVAEPPLGIDVDAKLNEEGHEMTEPYRQVLDPTGIQYDINYQTGDPATIICDLANSQHYDLIVMGTRGMSKMSELFLGSVSHKVIQHANCPVLTVK